MTPVLGELIGTALLILLGDGVVANVLLRRTKGEGAGLIVITWGWAMAVFVGVFAVARYSGAHLNPAVTVGLVTAGKFDAALAPGYILAQMAGAMLGAALVLLHYRPHFAVTEDPAAKLAVFSTGPAIRSTFDNLVSEVIGTFVHALLPVPGGKGPSDWSYAWIPVVGPLIGAVLAALLYLALGLTTMPTPGVGV